MSVSNNVMSRLIITGIIIATASPFGLDAMKRKRESCYQQSNVGVLEQYYRMSQHTLPEVVSKIFEYQICMAIDDIAQNCGSLSSLMHAHERVCRTYEGCGPDIPGLIVSKGLTQADAFFFGVNKRKGSVLAMVDTIAHQCNNPQKFVDAVLQVSKRCSSVLSAQIVSMGLQKAGLSLLDIKDNVERTALYVAVDKGLTNVVDVILIIAGKLDKDNAWKFFCMRDKFQGSMVLKVAVCNVRKEIVKHLFAFIDTFSDENIDHLLCTKDIFGKTLLHHAVFKGNEEIIKIILACVNKLGEREAWDLICSQDDSGLAAWDIAPDYIKKTMLLYQPI